MIFGALFGSFQYTLQLINNSRAKLSALSVANDRMEFFRSLPYDEVGTIAGIPPGTIPQNSTTTLNGIEFLERVLVEYVDDPADGQDTGTSTDSNGIPADYKRIKVEYTWSIGSATSSLSLISNVVPRSVETTAGGGTVRINVIDENSVLLPGASVRLLNDMATTVIDVTRLTDASGSALFSGAPAGSGYEVTVTGNISGNQYSTTGTYIATTTNPNPVLSPFAVLEADVSTLTFQIGALSDVEIIAYSDITEGSSTEPFADLTSVATSTNIAVDANDAVLSSSLGVYANSGIVYTQVVTPASLERWEVARVAAEDSFDTSYLVRFYTGSSTGPFSLIPNGDLPGNSIGFTDGLIDLSELDVATYPSITAGVTLATSDTSQTPRVDEIAIYYRESATARSGTDFTIRGDKTIGTNSSSSPIYKYQRSFTTDTVGSYSIFSLEFDDYTIENSDGYDLASACSGQPYEHQAGVDGVLEQLLVPSSAHTVRIIVTDGLGRMLPGAEVSLTRPGYSSTLNTNSCGQVFFSGGVSAASDYEVEVTLPGFTDETVSAVDVTGDSELTVTLMN